MRRIQYKCFGSMLNAVVLLFMSLMLLLLMMCFTVCIHAGDDDDDDAGEAVEEAVDDQTISTAERPSSTEAACRLRRGTAHYLRFLTNKALSAAFDGFGGLAIAMA